MHGIQVGGYFGQGGEEDLVKIAIDKVRQENRDQPRADLLLGAGRNRHLLLRHFHSLSSPMSGPHCKFLARKMSQSYRECLPKVEQAERTSTGR
jgi:hypothetical protein